MMCQLIKRIVLILLLLFVVTPPVGAEDISPAPTEGSQVRFQDEREEFKEGLARVRDEKKQAVLERLVGKFDSLNDKRVSHWQSILEKLQEILDRVA